MLLRHATAALWLTNFYGGLHGDLLHSDLLVVMRPNSFKATQAESIRNAVAKELGVTNRTNAKMAQPVPPCFIQPSRFGVKYAPSAHLSGISKRALSLSSRVTLYSLIPLKFDLVPSEEPPAQEISKPFVRRGSQGFQ